MNTKLIIAATVAALSLSTAAFAEGGGEGSGNPFPFHAAGVTTYASGSRDVGSNQLPALNGGVVSSWSQATLPENGQNGEVATANSLPAHAMEGTVAYAQAERVNQYFAQQAQHAFAQAQQRQTRPNG